MAALLLLPAPASAACNTRACDARAAKIRRIKSFHDRCNTWACVRRVRAVRARRAVRREWRAYRRFPMPYCTWGPESGGNYRARNPVSTAGGKYQMLDSTFHGFGGPDYDGSHDAAQAPPLLQERIARRVLRGQGLGAWVNC